MNVGERIRQIRIHKEFTQGELVSGICSITYLSRIENGQIKPSTSFLEKVAEKLDVGYKFLVDADHEDVEPKLLQICEKYKKEKIISEKDLSLLELYVRETNSIPLLLKAYGTLIYYHARNNNLKYIETIVEQASQLIPNRVETKNSDDFIYYLMARGHYYYYKQDNITAQEIYVQIESLLGVEESVQHADVYYNLSIIKQRLYQDQSISRLYSTKAYELYKKLNMEDRVIDTLIILALQYHLDKLHDKALETLKQAELGVNSTSNSMYFPIISYNYAKIYQGLKDYTNAIKYYEKSLQLSEFLHNETDKVYTLRSLIEIHIEFKDWENVNRLMDDAFKILAVQDVPYAHVQLYGFKATIFKLRGDYYGYEKEMQKAIEMGLEKKQYTLVRELATELGNHFYDNRAYKMSAKYLKISVENSLN
ncbi:XRE family transcriptional regulator [Bacillus pseudomycoides]|uniref:helix-turn-helix domain-containing protein n=1 Tax=Bacillus TaxID=1386 RepID=UPI0001A1481A|nr:helix-turn-helix transcriptional regulator [Bacillus pseudomycoides]EEM01680.1 transcriptional regulator/TPR domain protein [Bacillus pseudomycoides]EEM07680.1 transcriptional regulator/TPR domain protein [Bacillus pseudomycoides]MBD5798268.1 transcriptional regulator [Bacillus pseudomycoides]MCR8861159.1 helix-turn-helix domain-containing protein [Bacillus pseudomycoides]MED1477462.1 helix-turn-helix transcriptional regulator [Bacillus pseudomycoides]